MSPRPGGRPHPRLPGPPQAARPTDGGIDAGRRRRRRRVDLQSGVAINKRCPASTDRPAINVARRQPTAARSELRPSSFTMQPPPSLPPGARPPAVGALCVDCPVLTIGRPTQTRRDDRTTATTTRSPLLPLGTHTQASTETQLYASDANNFQF